MWCAKLADIQQVHFITNKNNPSPPLPPVRIKNQAQSFNTFLPSLNLP